MNRGLPPGRTLRLRLRWPLYLLPYLLISQLLTPHPVFLVLSITLLTFYVLGYFWIHSLAASVDVTRARVGTILVAGDSLTEEFEIANHSRFPLVWAEFVDASDLPGYNPSRVVGVGAVSQVRWKTSVECERRGLYRLGPHRLHFADLFGFFTATVDFAESDVLLIYPRVVQLPAIAMPRGNAAGADRRRRSMQGVQPAASVRDYQIGDSLRYIHWPTSAHRGDLTVKEMELEPSGDVWIVLDLDRTGHSGEGAESTLEYAVVVAASLAAALLDSGEQRAVGLLAASGSSSAGSAASKPTASGAAAENGHLASRPVETGGNDDHSTTDSDLVVLLPPQRGRAQLWRVLSALAPVELSDVSLAQLLRQSAPALGRRRSLVVITPKLEMGTWMQDKTTDEPGSEIGSEPEGQHDDWTAELLHLQALGLHSSALLITPSETSHDDSAGQVDEPVLNEPEAPTAQTHDELRSLLSRLDVPAEILPVDSTLPPLLTYRRKRTVTVSTPTGGVIVREIEEEVG